MAYGHWPEKPYWERPKPPDLGPPIETPTTKPPLTGNTDLDKLLLAIYVYIGEKLEPLWEAIDKLREFIDDTVGKIQELIDKALKCEHKAIEALVGKIYDFIGIQDGLLRQWTEEWVSEKLSFFSDTLLSLRQEVTSKYMGLERFLTDKMAEINDKLTLEIEILGHRVRINGENYDRVIKDLGFVREREIPAKINQVLVVHEIDPVLAWRARLVSEEVEEDYNPEPILNVIETEALIEQDLRDEPSMEGLMVRFQVEEIARCAGLPNTHESLLKIINLMTRPKGTEVG